MYQDWCKPLWVTQPNFRELGRGDEWEFIRRHWIQKACEVTARMNAEDPDPELPDFIGWTTPEGVEVKWKPRPATTNRCLAIACTTSIAAASKDSASAAGSKDEDSLQSATGNGLPGNGFRSER